jgi:hypothetical protein
VQGKQIIVDDEEKLKQYARQGYHYAQEMQRIRELEKNYKPYAEVDAYAKKDPDWWSHVNQSYLDRQKAAQQPQVPQSSNPDDLKSEVLQLREQFNQMMQQTQQRETAEKQMREEQELNASIESMRKQYPHIDLNSMGPDGRTLERQILEFAAQNGIQKFDVAFRAFNFDVAQKVAEAKAREAVVKDAKTKVRDGFLGQSSTPKSGIVASTNIRAKSYDDLAREALDELRAGKFN